MPPQSAQPGSELHVIVAAASPSSSSPPASTTNTTSIIIGVCVGLGCLVFLVVGFRVWKCTRRQKAPLPPRGPLAHDRERQMAPAYVQSDVDFPARMTRPGEPARFASSDLFGPQTSSRTDDSSIPPSSPSVVDSQVNLVQSSNGSEENGETPRRRPSSIGSTASAVRHHYSHRQRNLSYAGSVHSSRSRHSSLHSTIRGAPHVRRNQVDIVLPQPLAPGFYNTNAMIRPSRMPSSRASSRERRFEAQGEEYWPGRISTDNVSSPADLAITPNYPPTHAEYPPPVPRLPAEYSAPSSATTPPSVFNASLPNLTEPHTPHSADALLSHYTSSPETGPAPLPPPKDPKRRPSNRARRRSGSTLGR